MRNGIRILLMAMLLACASSLLGRTYLVGIGDICDPGKAAPATEPYYAGSCFYTPVLAIAVADSVQFYSYADTMFSGAHNVVADDGSFRCALGCDGEGGDGTPVFDSICSAGGSYCHWNPEMNFTRQFNVPGIVRHHDEVSGAAGVLSVGVSPAGAIDIGYTGTWFNPAQSGMGFMLQVLSGPPLQMLASWLTFSLEGAPSWIVGSVRTTTARRRFKPRRPSAVARGFHRISIRRTSHCRAGAR